jgi:hypothetical protein
MTDKQAMELALFALDIVKIHYTQSRHINEAITALKERLADPMREVQRLGQEIEQEPVAWVDSVMAQAQVFASAWSLVGGQFDFGNGLKDAEQAEAELRAMLIAPSHPPQRTEQEPDDIASIIACRNMLDAQPVPPRSTEQNFCPRCGKRTKDMTHIHTCTPPKD